MNETALEASPVTEDLFSSADLDQMAGLGVTPAEAARQIELFTNPPPFTRVLRPCTPGDGVRTLSEEDRPALVECFREAARQGRVGRLVPASGAATRMFKSLLAYLTEEDPEPSKEVRTFFDNLPRFAFYEALAEVMARDGHDLGDLRTVLSYLLTEKGLGYADLPKGLLLFHRYPDGPRTPFEEHLVEAAATLQDESGACRLHFTVSPEHEERFRDLLASLQGKHGARFGVTFSRQKHSTDTIAVDPDNRPFRQEDGTLLFRPGGHGALLDNLNDLGAAGWDVVQLKNIDNVVPDREKPLVNRWKELLGGHLLDLQERAFRYLDRLEWMKDAEEDDNAATLLDEVSRFLEEDLSRPLPPALANAGPEERRRFLITALDRPLRVCGVVINEGEPGGGPFWVESPTGGISPQIVETSQIDPKSEEQQAILKASTHFNPVDVVCGLKDRHGKPYDLHPFVDPRTVFIASKSHEGRPLKALERPGLWNGSMAGWNTVFVEVPEDTFAPVKTVLDLLRPEHQA
ncbi:MAG TPA: DUF4301 family protein [Thermoanaerobaculia bacterium]|nr:DUF4301 family protein [Thermoanaerobaculia bacterium]